MAIYRKNPPPGNFRGIGSGKLYGKIKEIDIPLHLEAGVQYGFRLTASAAGTREALYEGQVGSNVPAKGGTQAAVQYATDNQVVFTYTPSHSGDFYLAVQNSYPPSSFRVAEADHYNTSPAARTLAAAIGDVSSAQVHSAPFADEASSVSAASNMIAPDLSKHDG